MISGESNLRGAEYEIALEARTKVDDQMTETAQISKSNLRQPPRQFRMYVPEEDPYHLSLAVEVDCPA